MSGERYTCQNCGREITVDEVHRQEVRSGCCLAARLSFREEGDTYATESKFLGRYPRRAAAGPHYVGGITW